MRIFLILFTIFISNFLFANKISTKKYVVVLGNKLNEDCSMSSDLISRLDTALNLYKKEPDIAFILSGKGPGCQQKGEWEQMKSYLLQHHVQEEAILYEPLSMTTFENAWYTRLLHIEPLQIHQFRVVTSESHFLRAKLIFETVFSKNFDIQFIKSSIERTKEVIAYDNYQDTQIKKCYPILLKGIIPGDLKNLHAFFNGANMERRTAYNKCKQSILK